PPLFKLYTLYWILPFSISSKKIELAYLTRKPVMFNTHSPCNRIYLVFIKNNLVFSSFIYYCRYLNTYTSLSSFKGPNYFNGNCIKKINSDYTTFISKWQRIISSREKVYSRAWIICCHSNVQLSQILLQLNREYLIKCVKFKIWRVNPPYFLKQFLILHTYEERRSYY